MAGEAPIENLEGDIQENEVNVINESKRRHSQENVPVKSKLFIKSNYLFNFYNLDYIYKYFNFPQN